MGILLLEFVKFPSDCVVRFSILCAKLEQSVHLDFKRLCLLIYGSGRRLQSFYRSANILIMEWLDIRQIFTVLDTVILLAQGFIPSEL